jgi:hypothetical protein
MALQRGGGGGGIGFVSALRVLDPDPKHGSLLGQPRDIQRLPHGPLLFSVAQGIFDCPQRDSHAVHYHLIEGGEGTLYTLVLCSLATVHNAVMSCIDPFVRIVTKSPKVGPLLIFSIALGQPVLIPCVPDPEPPGPHVFGPPGSGSIG